PHGPLTQSGVNLLRHDAILSTRKDAAPNLGRFKHRVGSSLDGTPQLNTLLERLVPGRTLVAM
ncbi:MAG: hypothetical protein KH989_10085, partial [Kocuria rhizophila]|nr:hypothetical protein [Kocuria rhizophila]